MPRTTVHVCSDCGAQEAKWHGQCPTCGAWNTLVEEALREQSSSRGGSRRLRAVGSGEGSKPLRDVGAAPVERMSSGIGELDRVLGGGLVPGSLVLLGGSPGIGKSTLTNMVLGQLAAAGHRTLYVSGEESAEQVRLRAERLSGDARGRPALDVPILAETDLETILATLEDRAPGGLRDRLRADAALGRAVRGARLGRPGSRGRGADHGAGQVCRARR